MFIGSSTAIGVIADWRAIGADAVCTPGNAVLPVIAGLVQ